VVFDLLAPKEQLPVSATKSALILAETPAAPVMPKPREERIRDLAYHKWLAETGGQVVPEDPEGVKFWVEAEKEVDREGSPS
jgi:hypothetical protein